MVNQSRVLNRNTAVQFLSFTVFYQFNTLIQCCGKKGSRSVLAEIAVKASLTKTSSPALIHKGHAWLWEEICTWNSDCFPVKCYGTIILKRLVEAVQKVLTVRRVAATAAFANTSRSDSQRAMQHVRNPSCSPGHPLPTAERLMLQQASVI